MRALEKLVAPLLYVEQVVMQRMQPVHKAGSNTIVFSSMVGILISFLAIALEQEARLVLTASHPVAT
jgi:hypothetical protein